MSKFFTSDDKLTQETKRAELKICSFLAEHNISFRVMDHLSPLISETFHDSAIARGFSCKRTKAAALTYNVLAQSFKSTRLLNLVPVEGETAAELFETMENDLRKHNIEISHVVGFSADTTNVIFGNNNSIVTRILAANPQCMVIKCACHSCALAVSHACSVLPRHLEQLVKECYNYFSCSSKRTLEFQEFQDFTNSNQYRMLRFYSIRWLSFGSCVERIFNQWAALKLYFNGQHLVDRLQASEFLYEQFSNPFTKLYFAFLKYVIPVVNKMNTIFQSQSPSVHTFYSDCISAYKALLSCFVKPSLVKGDVTALDPSNSINHVPLSQIYLGVEVAKILVLQEYTALNKGDLQHFFQRCQNFYVELCCQLKKRLPLDNEVLKQLKFLDPQTVVTGSVQSIANIASRFPNVVSPENLQRLDQEWREFIYDDEISSLVDRCAGVPTEVFWAEVARSNSEKYQNLLAFIKVMFTIPVSNADSERVFSQVNLIKTVHRNRFSVEGVASLIFVKEGVKNEADSCAHFKPSQEMILKCNKEIYHNVEAVYGTEEVIEEE